MEKNLFTAIALSLVILFGYDIIFVAPKRAQALKEAKTVEIKRDAEKETKVTNVDPKENKETTNTIKELKKEDFLSTQYWFKYSNVGATLHLPKNATQKHPLPIINILDIPELNNIVFKQSMSDSNVFVAQNEHFNVKKEFKIQNEHLSSVQIINDSQSEHFKISRVNVFTIDRTAIDLTNQREATLDEVSIKVDGKITRKHGSNKFSSKDDKIVSGKVSWIAFRDHYNVFAIKPEFETKGIELKQVTEDLLIVSVLVADNIKDKEYKFTTYFGPQDINVIKSKDKEFADVIAYSNFAPIDWIAKGVYFSVLFIQGIIKSWGMSIILVSILLYAITYPLTFKSMLSMRKMQETQPKIKALQEKYKNDHQRLNMEIMEIYRREKINPLGGCLPFLAQMPIFIGLYQALWRASYFQGKGFLWIQDLSMPDRLFLLPFSLPFLGNNFNILPILMGIVMFVQQKISAKTMIITDETQAMQQKIMTFFFPVFIAIIFYNFASALSLYFTVFYLLSAITQAKMAKMPIKS